MDLNPSPSDDRLQAYYLDAQFNDDGTVTHANSGSLATVCRGTWKHVKNLDSWHGGSVVKVQRLVQPTTDDKSIISPAQPKIFRAVKQLRSRQSWPSVDYWPMISRGILCMVMANVGFSLPVFMLPGVLIRLGFRHHRHRSLTGVVPRSAVYLYRDGILPPR